MRRVFCGFVLLLLGCGAVAAQSAARPDLYFYKPPTRLADGSQVGGPAAVTVAIIDKALQYWGAKGKKVILEVVTIGFPRKILRDGAEVLVNATPEWVMRKTGMYSVPNSVTFGVIGGKGGQGTATVAYPKFWQPSYLTEIERLVPQIAARYDGNPTIAQVRISLGLLTGELPPVGWFGQTPAGYSEIGWIDSCAKIAAIYQHEFHTTQLEFQITRMASGYVFLKEAAYKAAVDKLVNWLRQHKVFLGYDHLGIEHQQQASAKNDFGYGLVKGFSSGPGGGLELAGGLWFADDIPALAAVVNAIRPTRLVMFGAEIAAINRQRSGPNPTNQTVADWLGPAKLDTEIAKTNQFLQLIGYR